MLMQNLGEQTKSIMVFSKVAYKIAILNLIKVYKFEFCSSLKKCVRVHLSSKSRECINKHKGRGGGGGGVGGFF